NNITDDTAAIQAAIDYAATNGKRTIYLPDGNYKITSSLYLDPPGNLRSNFANPPNFAFSLALVGDPGGPNDVQRGVSIRPTFNNAPALFVGPGQAMLVRGIFFYGPGGGFPDGYRLGQNPNSIGVALCGGNGGSSRTMLENVGAYNFYCGFKTGTHSEGVCDSNTWLKCFTGNVGISAWIAASQNFINSFYDCAFASTVGIFTAVGGGARVFGGNYSATNGVADIFSLGSHTNFVATPFR